MESTFHSLQVNASQEDPPSTDFSPFILQQLANPESLGEVSESHTASSLSRSETPPSYAPSGPDSETETGTSFFGEPAGLLRSNPSLGGSPQVLTLSSPTYPQESTQNQYTYPNLSDYVGYSHVSQLSPEQYRYIDPPPSHILREQHSPTADGYYQHFQVDSLTYNAATYHEENHRSSVFEATQGQLHMVAELQAGFDDNQGIPEFPLGADKEEDSNQSLPPVGSEENETVKQASVESLPKKVNPRRSKKRKQETPQDQDQAVQKPKQKRIRRAKKNLGAPEYIPADSSTPPRPGLLPLTQTKYRCDNTQKSWNLAPDIHFSVQKGIKGINLVDALNMSLSTFDERDVLVFVGEDVGNTVSLRVEPVGRPIDPDEKAKQIATRNHRKKRTPINKQKLARDIAKLFQRLLEEDSNYFPAPFKSIFLVRLINVSLASWQAELWYQPSISAGTSTSEKAERTPVAFS